MTSLPLGINPIASGDTKQHNKGLFFLRYLCYNNNIMTKYYDL